MDYDIKNLPKLSKIPKTPDQRGFLVEFLKRNELNELSKEFAQIYLATIAPNTIRGNHYHKTKEEFFVIISGKAKVVLEDINTKERKEIILDSSKDYLKRIRFGPYIAHVIKNFSDKIVYLVAYTTKPYDSKNLDQEDYKLI